MNESAKVHRAIETLKTRQSSSVSVTSYSGAMGPPGVPSRCVAQMDQFGSISTCISMCCDALDQSQSYCVVALKWTRLTWTRCLSCDWR